MAHEQDRVILEIKTSRTGEETPEAMAQVLASFTNLRTRLFLVARKAVPLTLELAVLDQMVHFYVTSPKKYQTFVEAQIIAQYPKALISPTKEYVSDLLKPAETLALAQLKLVHGHLYPLKTMKDFKDVDPMSSILTVLSKAQPEDRMLIQFLLLPISSSWQSKGQKSITTKQTDSTGATIANPYSGAITEKISVHGFKTAIRVAVNSATQARAEHLLSEIGNAFASFSNPGGNSLVLRRPILWQAERLKYSFIARDKHFVPMSQILNVSELATMFHLPGTKLATIHNISWHKVILSEPPETLPIAEGKTDEEKQDINFFARTEFKNRSMIFGIKYPDRRRHFYVIGKSGTGKSTFIANMAINDMRNRKGFCVIDPHGDLSEQILRYVPSYRVNDIIYMDPSDSEHAFSLNPLEVTNESQKELVASGLVAIFKKIFGKSWGPRLEYILRNTVLSVLEIPEPTLLMIPLMLSDAAFRKRAVERITDPVLKNFWENEFANMTDKLRIEAISPIQNKVGQFISSTIIRNIVGNPHSTIDLEKIMNEGKILILNLSQGYLGEDNAALLGAMIITKIQLAAMNRISIPEHERRDFYLYVDEFQNFATTSFIKILSEARKFRLNLILANQYIAQIEEEVRAAIFGNAGTLMTFLIGAADASAMVKEFGERFEDKDLVALGNYQAIIKLAIDGITQSPFLCFTLPLPQSVTQNKEKVIRLSRERYARKVK